MSTATTTGTAGRARVDPALLAVAAVLVASGLFHAGVLVVSGDTWLGPVSWRKPATFGLSFGVTLLAVAWLTARIEVPPGRRRLLLGVFAVDCVVEVGGITLQAWRGVPSHLNTSTPFDATVAYTLAAGGAVLVVVLGAFAVPALRGRVDGPASTVLAYRAGFGLLLAGLASGAAMIAVGTVAMRTGTGGAAHAYAVTGFLKAFHFVALHAVLVLPGLDWWLERRGAPEVRRLGWVRLGVAGYVLAAVVVLAVEVTALSLGGVVG